MKISSRSPSRLQVRAIGDLAHEEFQAPLGQVSQTASLERAVLPKEPSTSFCHLLLVCQSRPGSVSAEVISRAGGSHPLTGVVGLLGTWCEGETRTGRPLPLDERLFWYQFAPWWQRALADWSAGRPTSWQRWGSNRPTASEWASPHPGGLIAIDSPDAESARALIAACETLGYTAYWTGGYWTGGYWTNGHRSSPPPAPLTTSPVAGIWVGGQLSESEAARLAHFRSKLPAEAPLVALLDFPRHDRVAQAFELGATEVLGKPWRLEQLRAAVCGGSRSILSCFSVKQRLN